MSFTNNPSSILTDTSSEPQEKFYRYQWFIKNTTSVPALNVWTEISGATGPNLVWTPSLIRENNTPTDNPLSIILCVEDQPASAVPTVNMNDSTCSTTSPWVVTVKNNFKKAFDLSTLAAPWSGTQLATSAVAGQYGTETAIWYDTPSVFNTVTSSAAYIAMIGNDRRIYVKKSLVRALGGIDNIDDTHIVTFNALPSATVADVKDLSITGTSTELYIAYMASESGSAGVFYPQVRRIDLTATTGKGIPNNHPGKMGFDYDGLSFTNGCSSGCAFSAIPTASLIQFSGTGSGISGFIKIKTPNGDFTVNFGTYNAVNTVCGTCADTDIAIQLATIITNSTDPLLAGYSATSSLGTVSIFGARNGDYFDGVVGSQIADRLGKIYVTGGKWFLPFINSSLGSTNNDKLSVYSSTTGVVMNSTAVSILEPLLTPDLAIMDAAIKFDNYFDGTNLWIAMVSKTGSAGKLYKVNAITYAPSSASNIFIDQALLDVQISASSTTVFVGATTAVGNIKKLGIYDYSGLLQDEFKIDNPANLDPAAPMTDDYFNTASISQYKIVPYETEARLFAVSQGTPVSGSYKLYMARLRKVSSTWTLSCGDCQTVSELGQNLSPFVGLGVAPFRNNLVAAYRLSTDGAIPNQGLKDVAFVSMGRLETPTAASCDPAIGVFNIEGESIGSSVNFTGGVSPNQDAGLYHSPFIKN
jgi:hypothetical protein